MNWIRDEVRVAMRALLKAPSFTLTVILTLALGIGVNAAMYGVVQALLLRQPAKVNAANDIKRVYFTRTIPGFGVNTQRATSIPVYQGIKERVPALQGVALEYPNKVSLGQGAGSTPAQAAVVSSSYFTLLGIRPGLGRFFDNQDEAAAAPGDVVILSHSFWRARYGGNRDVLGQQLSIGGRSYTIIGITPAGFTGLGVLSTSLWLPLPSARYLGQGPEWAGPGAAWGEVLGRLAPGAQPKVVEQQIAAVYKATGDPLLQTDQTAKVALAPLQIARGPQAGREAQISLWLLAMAMTVFLLACANVTNLFVQRSLGRTRDVAIRLALGISRRQLAGYLLTEASIVSSAGGVLAILVAAAAGRMLRDIFIVEGDLAARIIDFKVVSAAAVLTIAAAIAFGLVPLYHTARLDLTTALKPGERGTYKLQRLPKMLLLSGQVASSCILLVAAGLFMQSSIRLTRIDPGFEASHVLVVKLSSEVTADPGRVAMLRNAVRDRLSALPGVTSVDFSSVAPLSGAMSAPVSVDGIEQLPQAPGGGPYLNAVGPGFFRTMGIPILLGRAFNSATERDGVIINETMANTLWPRGRALGRCVRLFSSTASCQQVIGIARDTRNVSLREPASMQIYTNLGQQTAPAALLVRSDRPASEAARSVRSALYSASPNLPFLDIRPLSASIEPQLRPLRAGSRMLVLFGITALLLSGVGLYGAISYATAQRRREIGIHFALGALASTVIRKLMAEGVVAIVLGLLTGVAGSVAVARIATNLLYGVAATDRETYVVVAGFLLCFALTACYLPAHAATRVQPGVNLRDD